jgi:hypothetical protein
MSETILPRYYSLRQPGIEGPEEPIPVGTSGLHVVFGPNNSGKTRLLRTLTTCWLEGEAQISAVHPNPMASWAGMSPFPVRWQRPKDHGGRPTIDPNTNWDRLVAEGRVPKDALAGLLDHLTSRLWNRSARFVNTDRYLRATGSLTVAPDPDDPASWAGLLGKFQRSLSKMERQQFANVRSTFEDLTEGLQFEILGVDASAYLHVVEGAQDPRPIDQCGDGLRDLLGLILNVHLYPEADLFVDDPGNRLHPRAQRRVLVFLEGQSRHRAIWMASHEGVFIGSPSIQTRYAVRRDRQTATSLLQRTVGYEECRQAYLELGWQPADAYFADTLLLCEGESDVVVFESRLENLARSRPAYSGVQVMQLGGSGVVWGKDRATLLRYVDLARRIAPHARCVVLLDRDDRSDPEISALRKALADHGVGFELLSARELEEYLLSPAALEAVLNDAGCENVPSHGDLAASINAAQFEGLSAERILENMLWEHCKATYRKVQGARVASGHLADEDAKELDADLIRALENAVPLPVAS